MGVSIRHNLRLAAVVALVAAVLAVAWFSRALQTGSLFDWLWCVLVAAVGMVQLLVVSDGRAPLMVADDQGVRVRHGETWSGLRWQDIEHVEVQSPASWLRDGQIVVHPVVGADAEVTEAYAVPLSRTTKLDFEGLTGDLVSDLDALASGRVPVLVLTRVEPEKPAHVQETALVERIAPVEQAVGAGKLGRVKDARSRVAVLLARLGVTDPDRGPAPESRTIESPAPVIPEQPRAVRLEEGGPVEDAEEDVPPEFEPVDPGRSPHPAARSEVLRESVRMLPTPPTIPAQRTTDTPVVVARIDPSAHAEPRPAPDALIGPLIAAARNRARLTIDTLSERTRIRPHVLESIEVDDFEACGGDFYARGHLRTLARIFGLEAQQLLDLYDDHYAKAEIEARQVFEAELASGIGGGLRAARRGPRWSLLAACVLALVAVWGVAHVFNDTPQELVSPAPGVVDSAGLATSGTTDPAPKMTLAPLEVTAVGASPQVVVRDREGRILWAGRLAEGQHSQVIGLAPFDVTSSNGSSVRVSFLGKPKGTVGTSSAAASKRFG